MAPSALRSGQTNGFMPTFSEGTLFPAPLSRTAIRQYRRHEILRSGQEMLHDPFFGAMAVGAACLIARAVLFGFFPKPPTQSDLLAWFSAVIIAGSLVGKIISWTIEWWLKQKALFEPRTELEKSRAALIGEQMAHQTTKEALESVKVKQARLTADYAILQERLESWQAIQASNLSPSSAPRTDPAQPL